MEASSSSETPVSTYKTTKSDPQDGCIALLRYIGIHFKNVHLSHSNSNCELILYFTGSRREYDQKAESVRLKDRGKNNYERKSGSGAVDIEGTWLACRHMKFVLGRIVLEKGK
jgi:hypothetical protein